LRGETIDRFSSEGYRPSILVVDDEQDSAALTALVLTQAGYRCDSRTSGADALAALAEQRRDVVVTDVRMPGMTGIELARRIRERWPDVAVILVTANPEVEIRAAATQGGVFSYVTTRFNKEELIRTVERAAAYAVEAHQTELVRAAAESEVGFVGASPQMRMLLLQLWRVAPTHATVLIEGESGTGKELVARLLHQWSHRSLSPFVALNCKAVPHGLMESELFGHERGSFTGAIAQHAGCFERASGGTLFLDEIGEVSPEFQAKLLRVLEDGEVLRVGGSRTHNVDVRVVAATNRMLRKQVAAGRFRDDLYFRLSVIPLRIPPLRDRPEDILPLTRRFLSVFAKGDARAAILTPGVESALLGHRWPGNIRELQNTIQRAVVLSGGDPLCAEVLGLESEEAEADAREMLYEGSLKEVLDRAAAEKIRLTLEHCDGSPAAAADELGVNRSTLYRMMKRLGIQEQTEHGRDSNGAPPLPRNGAARNGMHNAPGRPALKL
jgi:DNA-binding NtrC family response regulator